MKKVCVVTTTRADYGILSNLISKIDEDSELQLQLLVSGTHLSDKFGHTIDEINNPILEEIDIEIEISPEHAVSSAIEKFSKAFSRIAPDLVIILGDRYEILGVVIAAMLNNLPIAHINGGESTYGIIDEAIRHAITKMSHIHFTSCEQYKQRVIQLGEEPSRVFNVGSLGVENAENMKPLKKDELGIRLWDKNLLITYHPVTLDAENFDELLSALENFSDINLIFTMPGAEKGSKEILDKISEFVNKHSNAIFYKSLGHVKYISLMHYLDGVLGNSSSGIIEAPSMHIGTINIGDRQKGRIQASSTINCNCKKNEIVDSIRKLYESDFSDTINPYSMKGTATTILKIIKMTNFKGIIKKEFYDASFERH